MNVHLTFDVEVWCNDWSQLDARFPSAFDRYVYGRSSKGDYALPKTLEMLARFGLRGVFFVEPLFAARFGIEHLATIVSLIQDAGQDVQLHLHTEWVDELPAPPIEDHHRKRQHLCYYTAAEQVALLGYGARMLEQAGATRPTAFRAGSFACNRDTYRALQANGLQIDSSLNACTEVSGADLGGRSLHLCPGWIEGVYSVPVSVYRDGFGRLRSAQVNGSSASELADAMESGIAAGATDFVIVSHNFEMLKPGMSEPDPIVVRRFEELCAYLADHRAVLPTGSFSTPQAPGPDGQPRQVPATPSARVASTARRHLEQVWRRL